MTYTADIEKILLEKGVFVSTTSGVSMMPMLRNRQDTIVVKPVTERLKRYDVVLYKRPDGYVLHRVIKVLPDSYIIRGDNCICKEYGITDADVLGKLVEFYRGDKKIDMRKPSYRAYSVLICLAHPIVTLRLKMRSLFKKSA